MKRNVYWALSTLSVLVLLFGYHTSTAGPLTPTGGSSVHRPFTASIPVAGAGGGDEPLNPDTPAASSASKHRAPKQTDHAARTTKPTAAASPTGRPSASAPTASPKTSPLASPTRTASTSKPAPKPTPTPTPTKSPTKTASPTPKPPSSRTITGSAVSTRWGPVQVQLKVTGTKITSVSVLQYPNDNSRDIDINNRALPILINETLQAQSANIDMVSGATVTSVGYVRSLQSALDQL